MRTEIRVGGEKRSHQFTDKQQAKAKMPAAGATQALSAVCQPVMQNFWPGKK